MFPLEVPKNPNLLIFTTITLQLNVFRTVKNTCILSTLVSAMYDTRKHVALGYFDGVNFDNKIMTDHVREYRDRYLC